MKTGQIFKSKSKVQKDFVEYQYHGILPHNGRHMLRATNGETQDDCEVDSNWFDNRTIIIDGKTHITQEPKCDPETPKPKQ